MSAATPSGSQTVTFVFTDVEGSTALLERFPAPAAAALSRQHELIAEEVERRGGEIFERIGDAAYAAFEVAGDALTAAVAIQDRIRAVDWGELGRLHVRVTLHTGDVERREGRYLGEPLFRAARLLDMARGGETLLSELTAELVRPGLTGDLRLRDLGTHRLRDLVAPERVWQVVHTEGGGRRGDVATRRTGPASNTEADQNVSDEAAPIRVMLVDDHAVVRRGLRGFLELIRDFDVVGEAENGREAVAAADRLQPDVILMDLVMPEMDGLAAIAAIKQTQPATEIVAVTSFIEEEKVTQALEAGASGYLLKDAEAEEVAAAIRAAFNGEVHLDPAVARLLAQRMRSKRSEEPVEPLTQREKEVLAKLAKGASNKEIAYELSITERTARTHVSNILGKLGLASRTQAALWAVEHKLTDTFG